MRFTKRQKEILDYIHAHLRDHGYAPSLREIGAHFGLSSVATVHQHVSALADMGALTWDARRRRSLRPTRLSTETMVDIPILGDIAAGEPILAMETLDDTHTVAIPEAFMRSGEHFALRVEGDSMIDEGIHDGDILIVQQRRDAENGQVVVALIDGEEATVKKLQRRRKTTRLIPANPAFQTLELSSERVTIQGVVVGLIRRY